MFHLAAAAFVFIPGALLMDTLPFQFMGVPAHVKGPQVHQRLRGVRYA